MPKVTQGEKEIILNEILELLLHNYSRKDIVQYLAEKHEKGERMADNYLAEAYDILANETDRFKPKLIRQAIRRYNDLYDKNSAIQDYRECRAVQSELCKLFGLNKPIGIDHTSKGEKLNLPSWVREKGNES